MLVHCFAGKSRSATIIAGERVTTSHSLVCASRHASLGGLSTGAAAYLMHKQHQPFITVLQHIRTTRPIATPNPSFALQLLHLQKQLGIPPATANDEAAVLDTIEQARAAAEAAKASAATSKRDAGATATNAAGSGAGGTDAGDGDGGDDEASKRAALAKLKQTLVKKVKQQRGDSE